MNSTIFALKLFALAMILAMWTSLSVADSLIPEAEVEAHSSHLAVIGSSSNIFDTTTSKDSCNAYFSARSNTAYECRFGEVPPQVATWLFLVAIFGFIGFLNRNRL